MTLPRFFLVTMAVLAAVMATLLLLAERSAGRTILRVAEDARMTQATEVAASVDTELGTAERAVEDFERALAEGVVEPGRREDLVRYLTSELIALRGLTDITFTGAGLAGYDDEGEAILTPDKRMQVTVYRDQGGTIHRRTINDPPDGAPEGTPAGSERDPTQHDTFRVPARRAHKGRVLWSDLAFSQLDADLAPEQQRKTMTVQKAVFARAHGRERFLGVLRAGLVSDAIDRIGARSDEDGHRVFLCDDRGRLVTRLGPADRYATVDDASTPDPQGDVRVVPGALPLEVNAALAFARTGGTGGKRVVLSGVAYQMTLAPVAPNRAQGWLVGIVVPESVYVGSLVQARDRLLALLALAILVVAAVGTLGARLVGRGVRTLVASTEAMQRFRFDPLPNATSSFAEIRGALTSVERAKTALRAMVKYVPVDLVRRLYEGGRDPVLGAELCQATILFTDIADFTTHAESLSPDRLAQALGRYLEIATRSVESHGGTVDKFIGDALMVLWNVPSPDPHHPAAACRAALACAAATDALAGSSWWQENGLPPWRTRLGIHTDEVLVGNFGAPARLNYTAMGDGVNLASRLEGLNKIYGTRILVSAETRARAGDDFVFRQVDRVAVKGKSRAVSVFELVGLAGDPSTDALRPALARYEAALEAAFARRFDEALAILATLPLDGPAKLLQQRCEVWLASPPPPDWTGTFTATSK